jgi:uncharacterized protein Veg
MLVEVETEKGRKVKGELIKEYEHFYLIQLPNYRTTVSKSDILCGFVKINFLH